MPPLDSAYSIYILLSEDSRSEDQASSRYRLMIVSALPFGSASLKMVNWI